MRVIVSGSRHLTLPQHKKILFKAIEASGWKDEITCILEGEAKGIDQFGKEWAKEHGIPWEEYPVTPFEWETIGKAAGRVRNVRMARANAQAVVAIMDGSTPGTTHMCNYAKGSGIPVFCVDISDEEQLNKVLQYSPPVVIPQAKPEVKVVSETEKNHPLWVEKYRPATINDCILPEEMKNIFQKFIETNSLPTLLLSGSAGVGKTTVAKALCEQLGYDWMMLNGSNEGRLIDTLRTRILQFATTASFMGGRRCVIMDEADYLPDTVQAALRNFTEEFSENCAFIFTCNFKNKMIAPLQSRCSVVDFQIPKDEKQKLAAGMFKRVCGILKAEKVEFDQKAVVGVVTKYFPDFRRTLNELQRYSVLGKIDEGILKAVGNIEISKLATMLKEKNFSEVRKWVATSGIDNTSLCRSLYDHSSELLSPQSIPQLILHLAKYQYQSNFVADPELNNMAMLTEVMVDCQWK